MGFAIERQFIDNGFKAKLSYVYAPFVGTSPATDTISDKCHFFYLNSKLLKQEDSYIDTLPSGVTGSICVLENMTYLSEVAIPINWKKNDSPLIRRAILQSRRITMAEISCESSLMYEMSETKEIKMTSASVT